MFQSSPETFIEAFQKCGRSQRASPCGGFLGVRYGTLTQRKMTLRKPHAYGLTP